MGLRLRFISKDQNKVQMCLLIHLKKCLENMKQPRPVPSKNPLHETIFLQGRKGAIMHGAIFINESPLSDSKMEWWCEIDVETNGQQEDVNENETGRKMYDF
ncbi:hypothetical protein TNIN_470761 [Trichonephila inaurata madagascariensis]|uniref:Uncharacterized protein n=1 Tax=Trichonephila inaurata madagascariensis TaxID=2747483 RepID=A0A8X7BZV5_9ARAC|nr:hypothetical protein TNIN_470761 [Trichonephila inaurata madagascariensis]